MDANFSAQVSAKLKETYKFRRESRGWMREGLCPRCDERELYCAAVDPKMVKCGRLNHCGFEISVRDALPDLFDDWSKRFEQSEKDPNAAADAYLRFERGLDLTGLRGAFAQEHYQDKGRDIGSATVRFPLPGGSWWERIIDRPGRFDKKARFKFGGSWAGHCWAHPEDSFAELARADEIWIAEGIFDALALRQNFQRLAKAGSKLRRTAVSAMTVSVWPEHFLDALRQAIREGADKKHRPLLVFAFDVGAAGVKFTRKFVARARAEGWDADAAQVRPDGEGEKRDWNDLWKSQQSHSGDDGGSISGGPMDEEAIGRYRYNGAITIADSAVKKARLIHEHSALASFDFRFGNRIWWAKIRASADDDDADSRLTIDEVANCAFRILYRERDEAADETNYFLEIAFPGAMPTAKARFSAACCAASGEFKKRLFAFAGMWSGSQEQLDRLMRNQTRRLKTVEPIHFTGYSEAHDTWVLGDIAVRDGRLLKLNSERYFDIGKSAVKLRSEERILQIRYDPDRIELGWAEDIWTAWGPRGIVTLAFFTMSLFAVQIRARHASLGFLEIHGEAGSGKTTLIEFMWKLLGRTKYEGFDPNKFSNAAIARNFMKVSGLPVGLIESGRDPEKQKHLKSFDASELLTLYNGRSPRGLGVKSNGNETIEPPFLGSIYLMQNEPIDGIPAVLERIMSFRVDKSAWTDASRAAARRIESIDMDAVSGWIVHVTRQAEHWLKYFFDRYVHHDGAMGERVAGLVNSRIIKCHAQLAAAVEALGGLIPDKMLPKERIAQTLAFIDRIALERQQTSGGDHPVVARFWEIVDFLISAEDEFKHKEGNSLNQSCKPEQFIAISLVEFERRAKMNQILPPSDADLKRYLKGSQSRKFIKAGSITNPAQASVHCWVFHNTQNNKGIH